MESLYVAGGIYIWDWVNTLYFDWRLASGGREIWRWPALVYLLARFTNLVAVICQFMIMNLQNEPNCDALIWVIPSTDIWNLNTHLSCAAAVPRPARLPTHATPCTSSARLNATPPYLCPSTSKPDARAIAEVDGVRKGLLVCVVVHQVLARRDVEFFQSPNFAMSTRDVTVADASYISPSPETASTK
ncbi:hypothetical protein A0H81_02914 [Grifola frondosa]|uniref:Uncharacterized protein n=1 Tax=Grifola frondosa TaxID=5627 RepID=A0A1C7MHQ9_GRIFR|nr:hypothetical protein A0H81_02914 [Grifola frondosa]